jgi:hypothetical protein
MINFFFDFVNKKVKKVRMVFGKLFLFDFFEVFTFFWGRIYLKIFHFMAKYKRGLNP